MKTKSLFVKFIAVLCMIVLIVSLLGDLSYAINGADQTETPSSTTQILATDDQYLELKAVSAKPTGGR